MIFQLSLYLMATIYILAGINHFRVPKFYLPMMPPYIPKPRLMIALSGIAEIFLGALLLWPQTTALATWGIILMLIVFYSVHIYMFQARNTIFARIPNWLIIVRLPLQVALIAWAYLYT